MTVAEFNGAAIDDADAGVVELVDAPDSKSGSARSVGSIPTTRTSRRRAIALLRSFVISLC